MFEPQDHPDDIPYPGRPADAAVRQRRLDARVSDGREVRSHARGVRRARSSVSDSVTPPEGHVIGSGQGCRIFPRAINRTTRSPLLAACSPPGRRSCGRETDRVEARPATRARCTSPRDRETRAFLEKLAADLGLASRCRRTACRPALKLRPVRIALWDRYGGIDSSGWTRWLLERYEFPLRDRLPAGPRRGNLQGRYDVLILTDDARLDARGGSNGARRPRASEVSASTTRVAHGCADVAAD